MALVIIQTPPLSSSQKKRIGDRIVESLHGEGVPASSVVVLFQPDNSDVYLDGGLVHEVTERPVVPQRVAPEPETNAISLQPASGDEYKGKARRTRQELGDLRKRLVMLLEEQGGLSSFKAQDDLGLKDCEWAPATLRRLFGELEEEGLILKQGQKRGTRYVWKGTAGLVPSASVAKLVKRELVGAEGAFPGAADPE